ncbi:MAG: Ig-like domain-containing protein [Candidatus Kariarchaeaceae archaeon]|jgi:VCBS repeat-containing protein
MMGSTLIKIFSAIIVVSLSASLGMVSAYQDSSDKNAQILQNTLPVAYDDAYTVNQDITLDVGAPGVLANDTDKEGDKLTAKLASSTINGALTLYSNGSFKYTPDRDFLGVDRFTYAAGDSEASGNVATVTLTVINSRPVTHDDFFKVYMDTTLDVLAPGVLKNDTDAEGDTLYSRLVTSTSNGDLTLNTNGSFKYTPNEGFVGIDKFAYVAMDDGGLGNEATVEITVKSEENTAPVANDDSYTTSVDTTFTVEAPGVLKNDEDADGDTLTAKLDTTTRYGELTLKSDGSFKYTPSVGYVGDDKFTYAAADADESGNIATVTITVKEAENTTPVAYDDTYSMDQDSTLVIFAPGVLKNDTDEDGDTLSAILDTSTTSGKLDLGEDGSFSYTPNVGFVGKDRFTYIVSDGTNKGNTAAVTIYVNDLSINTPPEANDDSYSTKTGVSLNVEAPGVLENDKDADGDTLQAILVEAPINGKLEFNGDGSFIYVPSDGFVGVDKFTYLVSDSLEKSNEASVTITVEKEDTTDTRPTDTKPTDTEPTDTEPTKTEPTTSEIPDDTSSETPSVGLPFPIIPYLIGLLSIVALVKLRKKD